MPIAPGTRLGPYEVVSALGAGGMGEVYRARDTRLGRDVAIKILPKEVSGDAARKQRFEREAKTISSLNHPHICVLYDVGHSDGIDYLVMECIEGEPLAKRLEKGALPLEQVLKYGAQIADALDKAHRSGVVHRDLKPGNVMLTSTGAKLLDFGLAKPTVATGLATLTAAAPVHSPVTQEGTIVGTFQYMSPEQVEGKEVDARSDIFSFGTLLYEMVTGRQAFEGKTQVSVAAAILERNPQPITSLVPLVPPALDRVVRLCLAKARDERWQSAHDLRMQLGWIAESGETEATTAGTSRLASTRERAAWGIAALLAIVALALAFLHVRSAPPAVQVVRSSLLPPAENSFTPYNFALSPDGTRLAFVAVGPDGLNYLWVRVLSASRHRKSAAQKMRSIHSGRPTAGG